MEKQMKLFTLLTKPFVLFVLLFTLGVGNVWGWTNRTYDGNTKLYISNIKPNGWSNGVWSSDDNNQLFVCLKKSDNSETWCTPTLVAGSAKYAKGALYSITPPSGTYQRFNIVRGSAADWDHDTNSTNDLDFNSDNNFITHYKDGAGDDKVTWGKIDPRTITSDGTGVLYFDATVTSGFNWNWNCQISTAGDANFAFFFNNTNGEWSEHSTHITGDYYAITVPEGTWTGVILSRQKATSNPGFGADKQWNQTADIPFVYGKNCLTNYAPDDYDYVLSWGDFIPSSTILLDGSMNGWSLITAKPFSDGSLEVDLAAHKTYDFKIVEGNNGTGTWYGLTSANCIVSTMGLYGCSSSGNNIPLNTAGQGTYTFEYNASHQLSVTYPTASHPNLDYVYLRKYNDWANPHVHFEGTSASGVAGTSDGGQQLSGLSNPSTITNTATFSISSEDQTYFYTAVGDYPQVNLHNNDNGNNESGNKDVEFGRRLYHNGKAWVWGGIPVFIGLDRKGASDGTYEKWVDFNSTELGESHKITPPTKSHYDFGGFYTGWNSTTNEVSGEQVIDDEGNWIASVSGYTDASKHWIHAGTSTTLYAKWTEHEYTITTAVSPAGAGSVSCGSSTTAKYVTASGDITATANSGYSFREWGFSKVDEDDYDVYVSDESTYSSTKATIRIKAQRDGTLTANFTANGYTVTLEDRGADEGHKGTPNVSVTYDATTNLTSAISKPEKTYYTFDGYWTSNDEGETPMTQLIDANGNWKKSISGYTGASGENPTWKYAGNITLYAKWIETKHNVQVAVSPSSPFKTGRVEIGGSEVTEVSVGKIIPTVAMTAVAANDAFLFKEWQLTEHISRDEAKYRANDNPNSFFAEDDDQTITAVFQTRFGVIGSLKSSDAAGHGMPGWVWSNAVGFDVNGFTDFGEGEGKGVDFRYSTTLDPNTQYKFRLYDRIKDKAIGCAAEDVLPAEDGGGKYHNWQLNHTDDGQDILINTTGRGTYTFHITNISADDNFWPSIQVDRPTSYQLNLGWGYVETVDLTTVKSGNVGGTVTAVATEGGEENPITNGGWVVSGGTITFTPHPADDYVFAGWFTSSDYSSEFGDKLNPLPISSISGTVNVYAKFVEKSTTFEGDVVGHETEWNNTGNWSGGALPTINDIAIITKPVTVDIAHATAKSIVLDQNSHTGKLTIEANKGLEVVGTITRTTDGSDRLATREEDLVLESSSAGNASLVFNNSNSNAATVQMYSKASISGSTWNWQYVGTPFTGSIPQYNYYGSWMYKWNGGWEVVHGGDELTPFAGYCLTQNSATTHVMGGTLVPTTSKSVTMAASTDMVLANSWTAPISIASFDIEGGDATFTSTPATVYLFNTGMAEDGSEEGIEAGTYISVPIKSAPYTGNGLIAPMQGFFVTTYNGAAGSITMNYDALVRPAGSHTDIVAGPMKVRKQEETKPDVMKIRANGALYNDRVVILAREDFSEGFDNGWDGEKMSFGEVAPSVYVINEQGGYDAVSAIPSFEGTVVGFRAGANNSCTMSFEYDGDETLYLNDLQAQMSTLISEENNYTITTSAGDSEVRFIISATPIQKVPTGIEHSVVSGQPSEVRKLIINDHVYIIRSGRMYGVDGQMIK